MKPCKNYSDTVVLTTPTKHRIECGPVLGKISWTLGGGGGPCVPLDIRISSLHSALYPDMARHTQVLTINLNSLRSRKFKKVRLS